MTEDVNSSETSEELQKAIASGCRMLAIREHSEKQIRTKLQKKGFSKPIINLCVEYLLEHDWLSESRFCNAFIRSRANKGQGLQRIVAELSQQQIAQSIITQELTIEDIDWQSICETTLLKKLSVFPPSDKEGSDRTKQYLTSVTIKKLKKLENFLRYRGFSNEEIKFATKQYLSIKY